MLLKVPAQITEITSFPIPAVIQTQILLLTLNLLGQFLLRCALLGDISFCTDYEHKPVVQSALNLQEFK